jgi:hypothetical protein
MEKYKNKNNQDQNKEYIKISRKGLRRLGTTALTFGAVSGALGGWFGHGFYEKYQEAESQKIFEMVSTKKLDNSPMDFEKLEEISKDGGKIHLQKGASIRSTNTDYFEKPDSYNFNGYNHSSLGEMTKDADFDLKGEVYYQDGNNPRIITRIENFEQTSDGKKTKIDINIDKDGWVAVDANETDLRKNGS